VAALGRVGVVGALLHDQVEPADVLGERARVHDHRLVAVGVDVGDLGRVQDDVQVAAEDEIHAVHGQAHVLVLHLFRRQALVLVEAEVRHEHDQIHRRAQEGDVAAHGLGVGDGPDAERVAALEDAGHRRPVGHADGGHLQAVEVEDAVRLDDLLELGLAGIGGIGKVVVRGQEREARVGHDLLVEVVRARVELVVADDGGVEAEHGERAELGLTLELVEHRRALEAVARVEPERTRRLGALLLHDVADARDAAERAVVLVQAEVTIDAAGLELVREQARVDV
jgi:hypothetical protein